MQCVPDWNSYHLGSIDQPITRNLIHCIPVFSLSINIILFLSDMLCVPDWNRCYWRHIGHFIISNLAILLFYSILSTFFCVLPGMLCIPDIFPDWTMEQTVRKHQNISTETDYSLSLKCQVPGGQLVANPSSYDKFLDCVHERASYGDPGYLPLNSRLGDVDAAQLQSYGVSWHRACFQDTVHKAKIDRARQRFQKSSATKDSSILLSCSAGRPSWTKSSHDTSSSSESATTKKPFIRSSSASHCKDQCIFCNWDDSTTQLHEVCSFDVGEKIYYAVKNSDNDDWKVRLQSLSPNDARAIDVKYHLPCYVRHVQRQQSKPTFNPQEEEQNKQTILADIEFFNVLQNVLQSGNIVSMNDVTNTYNCIRSISRCAREHENHFEMCEYCPKRYTPCEVNAVDIWRITEQ